MIYQKKSLKEKTNPVDFVKSDAMWLKNFLNIYP
jgi:hypothetical protein